jgi:hypothetical protein
MGNINKEWHEQNKMPRNANEDQRIQWHLEHTKNCSCRPMPVGVLKLARQKRVDSSSVSKAEK